MTSAGVLTAERRAGQPPAAPSLASPADLAAALRKRLCGEVRFDPGSRALYATDLSIYRQSPIGVVIPKTIEDVIITVEECERRGIPILGRGCGTSLAGQCCNIAVVIDFSKFLHRLLWLDPKRKLACAEPGIIYDDLNDAAERYHLTFAPDPATHQYCTLGGMIGNNSCGVHSVMGGRTVDNVEELEILTYDGLQMRVGRTSDADLERIISEGGRRGEIYRKLRDLRDRYASLVRERYPHIPRRVSGFNLDELLPEKGFNVARALVGTEATCVLVLGATLQLMHSPPHRALLVIGYPDLFRAGDNAAPIRKYGPIGLEAVQAHVIKNMKRKGQAVAGEKFLPEGDTWLIVEFGGDTREEARDRARHAQHEIETSLHGHVAMNVIDDPADQKAVWHIRESGVGASRVSNIEDAWPSWEDAAVPPEVLGNYLRDFDKLLDKFNYRWTIFGHFGDGCVHCRITFDLKTREGVRAYRAFMQEAADLVVRYGGSLSGEHGDGQARAELLPKMYGPELVQAFREFKSIWDPQWKMNPGKVVDPYPLDTNLRVGPDYQPRRVQTYFQFPEDKGNFALATERCFGVGKCRALNGDTMCPSFKATREEMHTTRGRAHLLFEMIRGDVLADGWRDEHVKEALDLCLACKGCKSDCPVSVDIATYKAEFLAHYYEGRMRPRHAYAMGLISKWARIASFTPGLANFLSHAPLLGRIAKAAAGISQRREIPRFAPQTFRSWFAQRGPKVRAGTRVLLWPDTFNNYFLPQTAKAAVETLENAGCEVAIPHRVLCCGRPLYDYGMLTKAKHWLDEILKVIGPEIRAGTPIVFLEPSCAAVFRDELLNLFPNRQEAKRLSEQTFLFDEYLQRIRYSPPRLERRAIVHGHCHRKAILGMQATQQLLDAMGIKAEMLDSGCCGMAGSFGYECGHYDISMKVGEFQLLPRVRSSDRDDLVIADGFSCREQIAQTTERRALHLAEVLAIALHDGPRGPTDGLPEANYVQEPARLRWKPVVAIAALAIAAAARLIRRRR
ncbi:MAG TPA: FAD-linked oxidase C-terminal domain-containing protein [Candidatus Binatia bacterium]|nr:FAD-linked oxidase C-terminal domain-containing protein [Candidatus Binatia bacterium]